MLNFMREGGFAMWLILGLGGVGLFLGGSHALRPGERKLSILRPLSLSTLFASLLGFTSGLAATVKGVMPEGEAPPNLAVLVMTGIGESLCNLILGLALLTLAWLLVAVGQRRAV